MNILLDALPSATTDNIINTLLSYGVLGIVSIVLGYAAWSQYKRLVERNDSLEEKVDLMQQKMNSILIEDRDRMEKLVADNTAAIESLRSIIVDTLVAVRLKTN